MKITDHDSWSLEQHRCAMEAFQAHERRTKGHPLNTSISFDLVMRRIQDAVIRAAFIDDYVVLYDFGQTWCSDKPILYELLLLHTNLGTGGDFDSYIAGLDELARQNACFGVVTGNGVLRKGLRRQYLTRGFTMFNEAYFKEV